MNNFLDNGSILPSGLLGASPDSMMHGFNKKYRNTALRVGVITESFPVSHANNNSKLTTEYHVSVTEQNEDKGATTIIYRNCLSMEGMGSIADFLEKALRPLKKKTKKGDAINTKGQDGAIVLLLCLDGSSDKAIIIGSLTHPDRNTTIKDEGPRLEGEYNGLNVKIEKDGSAKMTFRGATDSHGKPVDASQGNTTIEIKKDGSIHLNHSTIDLSLARSGDAILDVKGKGNITINSSKDVTVNAVSKVNVNCENATVTAKKTAEVEGKLVKLGNAATEAVVKGDTFRAYFNNHFHGTNTGPSSSPIVPMPKSNLSTKVKTE